MPLLSLLLVAGWFKNADIIVLARNTTIIESFFELSKLMATMTSLQVDNEQLYAMNLQVLKRHDENMTNIVDMSSHVAVYEFDQANQSWVRGFLGTQKHT